MTFLLYTLAFKSLGLLNIYIYFKEINKCIKLIQIENKKKIQINLFPLNFLLE